MKIDGLQKLLRAYKDAPPEFQATNYWQNYEASILRTLESLELNDLRSERYPSLATFGFGDVVYYYPSAMPRWKQRALQFLHRHVIKDRSILPYQLGLSGLRELAYHHCFLMSELTQAVPIDTMETSTFGNPQDLFEVGGRKYTAAFLDYYIRYCFAHQHVQFTGDEIVVELGSGSGYQVEVLKKAYPNLTVLCFDLPAQIFLCENYLGQALGPESVVGTNATLKWEGLEEIQRGKVHFFGNWQLPLLKTLSFDVFWNAASFGEMEPGVVENYLSYVLGQAQFVYLLQARRGKETGADGVKDPIRFEDYQRFLTGYDLLAERDAWGAVSRMKASGGYFEGIWKRQ